MYVESYHRKKQHKSSRHPACADDDDDVPEPPPPLLMTGRRLQQGDGHLGASRRALAGLLDIGDGVSLACSKSDLRVHLTSCQLHALLTTAE